MNIKKSPIMASVLASAFAVVNVSAQTQTCNEADLEITRLDLEYTPESVFGSSKFTAYVTNNGPNLTSGRVNYDVWALDDDLNRTAFLGTRFSTTSLPIGSSNYYLSAFIDGMEEGNPYEVFVRYDCDPDNLNNSAIQIAYNIDPNAIFKNGFEQESSSSSSSATVKVLDDGVAGVKTMERLIIRTPVSSAVPKMPALVR